jgi:hypothetical protein
MIRKIKRFELIEIICISNLNTFNSTMLLTLKMMNFKNVILTKIIHIYVIKNMNIYYIYDKNLIFNQNIFISNMQY